MQTMKQFVNRNKIRLQAEYWPENPNMPDFQGDHWKCVLRHGNRRMTVYFSKGYGHGGKDPTASEVLNCLASDAAGYENARDFEDWCAEYGHNTDSRAAERTYHTVEKQRNSLERVLGSELLHDLLWNTEGEQSK